MCPYGVLIVSRELLNYDKNTFNQFTCVFIYLKILNHNVSYKKNEYKIQVSISHTPEGTDTDRVTPIAGAHDTTIKAHDASVSRKALCTTPVASGGEGIPKLSTCISWVLELCYCRYKPPSTS